MVIGADTSPKEIQELIDTAYRSGGHKKGWSYIYGPLLSRIRPEIVTIGLNPGGGRDDDIDCHVDADLSQDRSPGLRNSYFDQPWANGDEFTPLQKQIQVMHKLHFSEVDPSNILSFQFVPFRSPSWNEMPPNSYREAIDLGATLLDWTLGKVGMPRFVVGFGLSSVSDRILDWFQADHIESVSTGWGNTKAHIFSTPKAKRLILLPHLSRYRIFGRSQFTGESRIFRS